MPDSESAGAPPAAEEALENDLEDDPDWDAPEDEPGPEDVQPAPDANAESPGVTPDTVAPNSVADLPPTEPTAAPLVATTTQVGSEAEEQPEGPQADELEPAAKPEEKEKKKFPFKFFRAGVQAKLMYTHGTSDKNGLFDRDKSIQDSIDNGMVTMSGAGDLGETQFGGFAGGFLIDLELFGINAWLDFHKFFRPGGMWSALVGYDHDISFAKERLNLNLGLGFGLQKIFLGRVLSEIYYDEDNPESVNIGTTGMEMRAMVGLDIKIIGPLYTGPTLMGGYHYLWTANTEEVTVEKGLHYSAGWNVSLRFAFPK